MTIDGDLQFMVPLMLVAMVFAVCLLMHGTKGENY